MAMLLENLFVDLPPLETQRLLLRKARLEDAPAMFEFASDAAVAQYTTWYAHSSVEESEHVLRSILALYERQEVAPWGVEHKGDGKLIGTCGFCDWQLRHGRAELAYALSRAYWGQSYMSEAVAEVIRFGFQVLGLNRIEARCLPENVASARVMEKNGMRCEGILREQMFVKGVYQDLKIYSILQREWAAQGGGRAAAR